MNRYLIASAFVVTLVASQRLFAGDPRTPATTALPRQLSRITERTRLGNYLRAGSASLDGAGTRLAVVLQNDPVGQNPDGNHEVFLFLVDSGRWIQLTRTTGASPHMSARLSADGRFVVFSTNGDPSGHNADGSSEIFVADVLNPDKPAIAPITNAARERESRFDGGSRFPTVSDDGGSIVFTSTDDLTGKNADGSVEVFLVDRKLGLIQLTSSKDDSHGPGSSSRPVIDRTGARIVFSSRANLGGNADGLEELLLYDVPSGRTVQLTRLESPAALGDYAIDATANRIAFTTTADLTRQNADRSWELFLLDLGGRSAVTTQLTHAEASQAPRIRVPALSADGRRLAFTTSRDLTGQNGEGQEELFVADITAPLAPRFEQITGLAASGGPAARSAAIPSLDDDGSVIAFAYTDGGNVGYDSQVFLAESSTRVFSQFGTLSVIAPAGVSAQLEIVGEPPAAPNGMVFTSPAVQVRFTDASTGQAMDRLVMPATVEFTRADAGVAAAKVAPESIAIWTYDGFTWQRAESDPEPSLTSIGAIDESILVVAMGSGPPPPPPVVAGTGSSFRIMTYNTAFLATFDENDDKFVMPDCDSTDTRAKQIGEGVLKVFPDVVTFTEAFLDCAKTEMIDKLFLDYPFYVSKIDCPDVQDSGLMLFSKWEFVDLDLGKRAFTESHSTDYYEFDGTGSFWFTQDQLAFVRYLYCRGWDCFAGKGAGLVRVKNPWTADVSTVVFTHLQASYGDSNHSLDAEVRAAQLIQLEDLIRGSLDENELHQPIFIAGDLNIDGNLGKNREHVQIGNYTGREWEYHFHPAFSNRWFSCGALPTCGPEGRFFTDSWGFTTSEKDYGQTNGTPLTHFKPEEGERPDYILHSSSPDTFHAAQHTTRRWDVGDLDGTKQYSDHLPIHVDYNRPAPRCTPREAYILSFSPNQPDLHVPGDITWPGSMQWYRLPTEGTYSIRIDEPDVSYAVYAESDLSRPVPPYHELETDFGAVYLATEPLYVRVWADDRTFTGSYTLKVHKHQCGQQDPCVLPWGDELKFAWPAQIVGSDDEIWYMFHTNVSDVDSTHPNHFPSLAFHFRRSSQSAAYEVAIREQDPPHKKIAFFYEHQFPGGLEYDYAATHLQANSDGSDKLYYLTIQRDNPQSTEQTWITATTNLTYFYPEILECKIQNDNLGDDEIWYFLDPEADGATWNLTGDYTFLHDFDEGSNLSAAAMGPVKYCTALRVNLIEEDSGANGDDDYLYPKSQGTNFPFADGELEFLPRHAKSKHGHLRFSDTMDDEDADYSYRLHGELRHESR